MQHPRSLIKPLQLSLRTFFLSSSFLCQCQWLLRTMKNGPATVLTFSLQHRKVCFGFLVAVSTLHLVSSPGAKNETSSWISSILLCRCLLQMLTLWYANGLAITVYCCVIVDYILYIKHRWPHNFFSNNQQGATHQFQSSCTEADEKMHTDFPIDSHAKHLTMKFTSSPKHTRKYNPCFMLLWSPPLCEHP